MAKRSGKAKGVALGGVTSALSLSFMLLGSFLPASEYITTVAAGLVLIATAAELGYRYAIAVFIGTGILALIILPSKEIAMLFVSFFGYYPIIKLKLDKFSKLKGILLKYTTFNIAITLAYTVVIYLFTTPELRRAFFSDIPFGIPILYIIANVFFTIYDKMVLVAWQKYFISIAPTIKKII